METVQCSIKEAMWHKMRADLASFIPQISETNLLMCCACGRFLSFENFSLEHIIPQQSLKDDPKIVKQNVFANTRAGNILLCQKPIQIKGKIFYSLGCNSYKGKHYDSFLREVFNRTATSKNNFHTGHHISLVAAGYLAMIAEYGYQPALTKTGLLIRSQFFNPRKFLQEFPISSQMVLMGEKPQVYDDDLSAWKTPFIYRIEDGVCHVVMRGLIVLLPLSRDPRIPIAKTLRFAPSKYTLRPDFSTVFD